MKSILFRTFAAGIVSICVGSSVYASAGDDSVEEAKACLVRLKPYSGVTRREKDDACITSAFIVAGKNALALGEWAAQSDFIKRNWESGPPWYNTPNGDTTKAYGRILWPFATLEPDNYGKLEHLGKEISTLMRNNSPIFNVTEITSILSYLRGLQDDLDAVRKHINYILVFCNCCEGIKSLITLCIATQDSFSDLLKSINSSKSTNEDMLDPFNRVDRIADDLLTRYSEEETASHVAAACSVLSRCYTTNLDSVDHVWSLTIHEFFKALDEDQRDTILRAIDTIFPEDKRSDEEEDKCSDEEMYKRCSYEAMFILLQAFKQTGDSATTLAKLAEPASKTLIFEYGSIIFARYLKALANAGDNAATLVDLVSNITDNEETTEYGAHFTKSVRIAKLHTIFDEYSQVQSE